MPFDPRSVLAAGFVAGTLLRWWLFDHPVTFDVPYYERWAALGLERGLLATYTTPTPAAGSYFPFQIELLIACRALADAVGARFETVLKGVTLGFDLASFAALIRVTTRLGSNALVPLIAWLHPWFLLTFALGYVDGQFSFFVIATAAVLVRGEGARTFLWAGLPLGVAFTMKPQAQVLVAAIGAFALFDAWRRRRTEALWLLVFPVGLFVGWSLVLATAQHAQGGPFDPLFLARRYLATSGIMPCLNGTRLNLWYPIALALKGAREPVYAVSDQLRVLGPIEVRHLAGAGVLAAVALFARRTAAAPRDAGGSRPMLVLAFAALVVPYAMTQAHENHFYAGSLLMLPLLASTRERAFHVAVHTILLLDALNAYALYAPTGAGRGLRRLYSEELRVALSLVSTAAFAVAVRHLWRRAAPNPTH